MNKPTYKELLNYIYEYGEDQTKMIWHLSDNEYNSILNGSCSDYRENRTNKTAINISVKSEEVMNLVNKHYKELWESLVYNDETAEIFNDTVLTISYKYKAGIDFIEQFTNCFNSNMFGYVTEKKYKSYLFDSLDNNPVDLIDEEVFEADKKYKLTINNLLNALPKEARKTEE